jgi:hypothetical protein
MFMNRDHRSLDGSATRHEPPIHASLPALSASRSKVIRGHEQLEFPPLVTIFTALDPSLPPTSLVLATEKGESIRQP